MEKSSSLSHGGLRTVILSVIMIISVGYIFLWIITPTNLYRQTLYPKIQEKANSTYFGTPGVRILIFTFPVLLISTLGCVYLHLRTNFSGQNLIGNVGKNRWGIWRRPMIIKGLGIVSRIELAFFLMFIALLIWSFSNYLRLSYAKINAMSAAKEGEKVWEAKLDSAALRLGLVGNIGLAFLFFPVTRGSSVLPVFGLTSEASIKYHIWVGHIVMTLFTAHGICYVIFWAATNQLSEMLKWAKTDISNVAGEIALLAGLAMWATTFPRIRRKMFEVFFYTHHLYIIFMLFFVFHVGFAYTCIMLPGFYLYLIDRFLRFLQSRERVRLVSARVLPCQAIELNFSKSKGLSYTPTSIMFINIPSLSKLQWHPFTITSSSNLETDKLSVLIKAEGSWSNRLHQILSSPSSIEHLDVSVEGPYGPPSTHFLRHDLLVMVSGGSGITPFISIIRELTYMRDTLKCQTPDVLLISAFKNCADLTMLDVILPISGTPSQFSQLGLQIEAYVTREMQQQGGEAEKANPVTVWFKPKPTDEPIAPTLGRNSWLWLGAIISSSFLIFLLFMGVVTQYYIYPIDHNTNKIYSLSARAALSMLLICLAIAITSTAVFLWNKKLNAGETKQIQSMERTTPYDSPDSWFYNADRELESLPNQSIIQSTRVHFGRRPDLKKILFERKESSVGVLVCGPKSMRHDVSKICSSDLAANLHFESISFSW